MVAKVEVVAPKPTEKRGRSVSGIASPYWDNDASLKVADIIQNVGGGSCAADFLVSKLGYKSIQSGTYLTRVAAARMFGYVSTAQGKFVVTERALSALQPVMPEDSINAKADAFLSVPLFAKLYEDFRGRTLPPEVGLRNLFLNSYRILPDRIPDALRVFMNSAAQCGFFDSGRDRLIRPATNSAAAAPQAPPESPTAPQQQEPSAPPDKPRWRDGGGDGGGGGIHSALIGLLRELPKPGESWTTTEQDQFLNAFTGLVKFIFPVQKGEP